MTYTITSPETAETFEYTSETAYLAAEDWYNRQSKEAVVEYCRERGVELITGDTLFPDWADRAMHCYASQ